MKFSIKEVLYIIGTVAKDIIAENWLSVVSEVIKMTLLAAVLFAVVTLVPHNIPHIKEINFLGCMVVVFVTNVLFRKNAETEEQPDAPEIPNYLNDEPEVEPPQQPTIPDDDIAPPPNIRPKLNENESTRE